MDDENVIDWFWKTVGSNTSINAAAAKAGLVQSTLNSQVKKGEITPETVVAIAKAYGRSAIRGLVIQGLIDESDLRTYEILNSLRNASDKAIIDEVARRIATGADTSLYEQPVPLADKTRPQGESNNSSSEHAKAKKPESDAKPKKKK